MTVIAFDCPEVTAAKSESSDSFMVELRINLNDFEVSKENGKDEEKPKKVNASKLELFLNHQSLQKLKKKGNTGIVSMKLPLKYL